MGPLVRTERRETLAVLTWEACCSAEAAERVFRGGGGVADILEAARLLLPAIVVRSKRYSQRRSDS
jgi:hypothetical protein